MVAISLYRGNLHRVPATNLRRWPPPPPAFTLRDFRRLLLKRAGALARLPPPPPPPKDEEGMGDSSANPIDPVNVKEEPVEAAGTEAEQATTAAAEVEAEGAGEPVEDAGATAPQAATIAAEVGAGGAGGGSAVAAAEVKMEATDISGIIGEKETRKTELEKKLQVLNDKKHHLVQMLKQILHTEEEIKRRSFMTSGFRASIPIQPESAVETGSVTRHAQKLSVDVNFGGDLGGEVDVAATNSNTNVMNTTSPASLTRLKHGSVQHNTVLHNTRASAVAVGHGQPSTPSSTRSLPPASASPFSPTVNKSHAASSTPMSVPGTSFAASPASGGVSSARLASSL